MLDSHVAEWLNLALRWAHVIVGIAWIGTSFYFVWLENRLMATGDPEHAGEVWSVHGGGFYRVVKFSVAPDELPSTLHWFKWEAYSTWLTGFVLLFVVFYMGPLSLTVDPAKADLSRLTVTVIGVAALAVGWVLYDALCRTPLLGRPFWFGLIGLALTTAMAYGLEQLMTSRAAFVHIGALIGTLMAGNVFFVIIPGQRQMVDTLRRGEIPDPAPGRAAAKRSLHNNYLTLPVVFVMISSHFPTVFGSDWNWALLGALFVIGAGTRHWFNLRGQGRPNTWILPAAALALLALIVVTYPRDSLDLSGPPVSTGEAVAIVNARCTPCHATVPAQPGFTEPPKGVILETAEDALARGSDVLRVAVRTQFMPAGNLTGMTEEERRTIGRWIVQSGAGF